MCCVTEGGNPVGTASDPEDLDRIPTLPAQVPVIMPELPPRLIISTVEQFKAIAEPTRTRILGIIQNQPATAKQIADRLKIAPGAVGHHLQVLEAAGLAQVVAKRLVRGIVAKYYARTARIFAYDIPPEVTGGLSPTMDIATTAVNELAETMAEARAQTGDAERRGIHNSFPHARISPERAQEYAARLDAIVEEMIAEPHDPNGEVYGMFVTLFRSPDYLQGATPQANEPVAEDEHADEEGEDA